MKSRCIRNVTITLPPPSDLFSAASDGFIMTKAPAGTQTNQSTIMNELRQVGKAIPALSLGNQPHLVLLDTISPRIDQEEPRPEHRYWRSMLDSGPSLAWTRVNAVWPRNRWRSGSYCQRKRHGRYKQQKAPDQHRQPSMTMSRD